MGVAKRLRWGKSRGSQAAEVESTSPFVAIRYDDLLLGSTPFIGGKR